MSINAFFFLCYRIPTIDVTFTPTLSSQGLDTEVVLSDDSPPNPFVSPNDQTIPQPKVDVARWVETGLKTADGETQTKSDDNSNTKDEQVEC